ncbi:endolytic transglycosylase MltG [Hansschlegelia zhihuaiae]|uniref:Endolytic murein transglycosylase n=2 Tax=Hansschlegelia zhihuaiae TaxID=405005 RepID=A0A4Q0MM84_9HYPH|nr:endolytic transglycosylase MltG [Hansschlegelia zhihuaiae]
MIDRLDHAPEAEAAPPSGPAPAETGAGEAKPRKRRRDGALVGYLSGVFTLLTLATLAIGGALYWGKSVFDRPGPLQRDTTVMVQRNQGVTEIADSLARAGVIDDANIFKLGVAAYGAKDKLRFGEYAFPAKVSMREAMEIIVSGKSIEHAFTVPEGLTSLQIVERLRDQPLLTGEIKEAPPEGALLPETYKFTRGDSREKLIARMRQHREEVVERVWRERDPGSTLKSVDELVTLASLVEKETGIAEERPRVAAVFANRLARGMRLQSDPTIVYGLVGGRGTLGRSLTRADIQSRTPYNTYVVPGLPAGPIANPGRDALEAAARPAKTKDLYFVADGSGGHAFAPTLVEHNRNVANWRRIEKARGVPADRLAPDEQTPEASNEGAETANAPAPTPSAANSSSPPKPAANDRRRPREQR